MNESNYAVVMFAYNEEKNIERSVNSIFNNVDENLDALTVIANGCTDNTVPLLKQLKQQEKYSKLRVIELNIGDKCNAWNEYVHKLHTDAEVHFFTDADVEFTDMAFPQMHKSLIQNEQAQAIAGLPFSGRNIETYRKLVTEQKCLFGNCYGVKKSFLLAAQEKQFYLPIGLCWIDSAITKVLKRDFIDQDNPIQERVTFNPNCGYKFKSLSPFKIDDIKLYFSRIARYQTGQFQETYLEKISFLSWPRELSEINKKVLEKIETGVFKPKFYLKNKIINRLKKSLK